MHRPALNDLDAVMAIARRGSFRAAALDLGMSTTALSSAIGKLEAELGVRLFNRTTRSVSLTDAGRLFVDQIGIPLRDIHDAIEAVRSQQAIPSGVLRINSFAIAAQEILPLVLEFLRRYPKVHVDIVTEERLVDIVADGFDLGVRSADLVPSDMIAVSLGGPLRRVVVAAPAYLAGKEMPRVPTDLGSHSCIRVRLPNGALYRWEFRKGRQTVQLDVSGPITLDEPELARRAVLDGVGIGFFMEPTVICDLEAGRLVRVLEDWTPPFPELSLYYPSRRNLSAAHAAFVTLAREHASRIKQGH
jgi:DNA-binding transcriptional LysR family regulator